MDIVEKYMEKDLLKRKVSLECKDCGNMFRKKLIDKTPSGYKCPKCKSKNIKAF